MRLQLFLLTVALSNKHRASQSLQILPAAFLDQIPDPQVFFQSTSLCSLLPSFSPSLLPSFHKAAPCLGLLAGKETGGPEVQVILYLRTRTEYGNLNRAKHGDNAENRTWESDTPAATSFPQEGLGGAPEGWAPPTPRLCGWGSPGPPASHRLCARGQRSPEALASSWLGIDSRTGQDRD